MNREALNRLAGLPFVLAISLIEYALLGLCALALAGLARIGRLRRNLVRA